MNAITRPAVWMMIVAAAVASYAIAAMYLHKAYVDPRPEGRKVRLLSPPFERVDGVFVVKYGVETEPEAVVYENKEPLDPIKEYRGHGYFQILPNGISFSATDGTNPNESKHRYWLVIK